MIVNFYLYSMVRRILQYLAAILFFCSLLLPAFTIGDAGTIGLGALIYGWVGIGRSFGWSWLANPFFILTLVLFLNGKSITRRIAIFTAAAAFLFSLSFLLVGKIPGEKTEPFVGIVRREAGYWIWLYSMAALLIAAILNHSVGSGKLQPDVEER